MNNNHGLQAYTDLLLITPRSWSHLASSCTVHACTHGTYVFAHKRVQSLSWCWLGAVSWVSSPFLPRMPAVSSKTPNNRFYDASSFVRVKKRSRFRTSFGFSVPFYSSFPYITHATYRSTIVQQIRNVNFLLTATVVLGLMLRSECCW